MEKKKLLLGAVAGIAIATAYTAPVDAKVTLMADEPSGWSFSVDGNVNAFYVYSTGKNANMANGQTARLSTGDNSRIQTGLLPSKFGFGVQGPASNGVQLRGYFGLYPQIQNANTKTARGAQLDMREIYAAASGDFGEVLFGRTLSLFQRNAIVQDMTLFGVGATADNTSNGGTTLGRIGFGYVYPDFNASFRWTSPSYNGTTIAVGVYDPSKITAGTANGAEGALTADESDLPRIDSILISHNHYDHLDTKTLSKIKNKKDIIVVCPLNLSKTINSLGYNKIVELDWYDKEKIFNFEIIAMPSYHWSRRLGQKRNSTLWNGYLIKFN